MKNERTGYICVGAKWFQKYWMKKFPQRVLWIFLNQSSHRMPATTTSESKLITKSRRHNMIIGTHLFKAQQKQYSS